MADGCMVAPRSELAQSKRSESGRERERRRRAIGERRAGYERISKEIGKNEVYK